MAKILLQDGDPVILELLEYLLHEEGFTTLPLDTYQEVLDQLEAFQPDVAILDFKISGKDCIETCRHIRSKHPDLPVIAASANILIDRLYAQHGFSDYIPKPFDLDDYLGIIHRNLPSPEIQNAAS